MPISTQIVSDSPAEPSADRSPSTSSAPLSPQHALRLLTGVAGIAILGDVTLRVAPWGLNFPIWTVVLVAAAWLAIKRHHQHPAAETLMWLCSAVMFASFLAWRDASFLHIWNFAAVFAALSVATLRQSGAGIVHASAATFAGGTLRTTRNLLGGAATLAASDIPWKAIAGPRKTLTSHALGLGLAVPAVLVFGSLFAAADPLFEKLVTNVLNIVAWDLGEVSSHGLLIILLAWISAGYIRGLIRATRGGAPIPALKGHLGTSAVIIPLSVVTFLFLVFVVIQVGYLFGGEAFVREATGLTYAEYARRGFFELVTAAALVLPLLHTARWAMNAGEMARRIYRVVSVVLLLLVDLVTISAIWRMRLYTVAFGLTEDRLYATAFMFWIGFLLAWFAATAFRDRAGFAFGALVSGFTLLATLNILNPEGLIVRANVARLERGESFDISYINTLSDDAVPALVSAWDRFDDRQRCELRGHGRPWQRTTRAKSSSPMS